MSLDSARLRFENRHRSLFRDTAVLERPATGSTFNSTTGTYDPNSPTQIYSGACEITGFGWEGTDVEVGGNEVRLRRYQIDLPVNTDAQVNDIIRPTESIYDTSLVGRSYRITDVVRTGRQITRRVIAEEITGDA